MEFKKGDKVKVWSKDTATVTGISTEYKDNQGKRLIQLDEQELITPQALTKAENSGG